MAVRFSSLEQWLHWQETLHPSEIELGLDRVRQVYQSLCPETLPFRVVTVAGTNGKGSSIAALEAILLAAGYHVASYTSPHLLRYNERIRLNGEAVSDQTLMAAFEQVDQARQDISLTYFEFGTLAALRIFYDALPQIVLLEVGLGGRLDAVNVVDADVALITSIGVDHVAWLGNDRESIAREKAGIMRSGRPVVCSDPAPPAAIARQAEEVGAELYQLGEAFDYQLKDNHWCWHHRGNTPLAWDNLPPPGLPGEHQYRNLAGVLMVLSLLQSGFPLSRQQVRTGLLQLKLPGRLQLIPGDVPLLLDVAHNPDGTEQLARTLQSQAVTGRNWAIVGMMGDKDIRAALAPLIPLIAGWYPVDLNVERAATASQLAEVLTELHVQTVTPQPGVAEAIQAARNAAQPGDRIVLFGSFYTVADALAQPL
jgi:dihydrofolate synthase/folylpolyglutamate synthase